MAMTARWDEGYGTAPGLRDALRSLLQGAGGGGELWRLGDAEVADALAVVGQARALLEIAEVDLVREGLQRGLPGESSWSPADWVTRSEGQRAPDPSVRHTASVVRVARAGTALAGRYATRASEAVGAMREAFEEGDLPLGKADQLARFHAQVAPVADEEMLEEDLGALVAAAKDDVVATGPEGRRRERVRGLGEKELAVAITRTGRLLKPEKESEDDDRRAKRGRSLTKSQGPAGMSLYRVVLDPEGAAVVDAALAALSGPVKGPDGEADERPATQRRADALVEIIRRGVASPGAEPKCEKAQVVVTIGLDDLHQGTHGAGVTATGQVLAPSVVRKLACDAGIVPVVLGGDSEILDLGRSARWFTPGQKRALWLRDGGCTYPGCTMPPQWCDAHHVAWWSRGGASDIGNAALLCERHHTRVHTRDLRASITPTGVTWHL
ncbi:HNH endonuclease signature motif containing protein [Janibacter sp. DB-40]|uniref:HNH endonuclease n=1 Tax=Janibacter sp. DB-40 TaxID=3028808 RepID=UPI002404ABAF|nr:HNH endonuclease signature motif containing protein [Janibacter sp. DB-40]